MKPTHVDLHRTKIEGGMISVVLANYLYSDQEERNSPRPQVLMATKELGKSGYQSTWEVIQSDKLLKESQWQALRSSAL